MKYVWHFVIPFIVVGNSWVTVRTYDNTCHQSHRYVARFVEVSEDGRVLLGYSDTGETDSDSVDILDLKQYNEIHTELGPFTHSFKLVDGKVENKVEGRCGQRASRNEPKIGK